MISILKRYSEAFFERYRGKVAVQVENTLMKLHFCRTPAMRGHVYKCDQCLAKHYVYNSCGDRHCPQCMGARRADWIEGTEKLLRDDVTYFQVVFTIPDRLSSLVLGNRQELYDLLFQSAWKALHKRVKKECGIQPAAAMVLHT